MVTTRGSIPDSIEGKMAKKRINNKSTGRNYKKEYEEYGGTPEQIKRRSMRNKARRKMEKAGKVRKGDGKEVDHINGVGRGNSKENLRVLTAKDNRSYPRNSDHTQKRTKRKKT